MGHRWVIVNRKGPRSTLQKAQKKPERKFIPFRNLEQVEAFLSEDVYLAPYAVYPGRIDLV